MSDNEKEQDITINGITFTTKEAFARYREEHTFRVGDAINVMCKEYSTTKVHPGFITGISDFGNGKVTLDIAYIGNRGFGSELEFAEVFTDECGETNSPIVGIAPINEFNDLRMRLVDCVAKMEKQIATKKSEIAEMEKHIARLRAFDEKIVKV